MENLGSTINNYAQRAAVAAETKVSEWINDVIRFVGELIFQMSYYGMLVAQRIFMTILATFAPIMFALSIVPPWSNAWAQWMGKYLSLSLWGFVVYFCLYYIDFILMYNLMEDIKAYDTLLRGTVNSWQQIGALGLQGIGSNCMYAMGMLVGAYVLRFVPEVASWLIPGGISSSAGTASGSMAQTLVFGGASYAMVPQRPLSPREPPQPTAPPPSSEPVSSRPVTVVAASVRQPEPSWHRPALEHPMPVVPTPPAV